MATELEERLQKAESHLAQLEYLYEQLNQVVVEQGEQLRRLQQAAQRLATSLETSELERIRSTQQKPPHYQ